MITSSGSPSDSRTRAWKYGGTGRTVYLRKAQSKAPMRVIIASPPTHTNLPQEDGKARRSRNDTTPGMPPTQRYSRRP